jgi:hypothetical protein
VGLDYYQARATTPTQCQHTDAEFFFDGVVERFKISRSNVKYINAVTCNLIEQVVHSNSKFSNLFLFQSDACQSISEASLKKEHALAWQTNGSRNKAGRLIE